MGSKELLKGNLHLRLPKLSDLLFIACRPTDGQSRPVVETTTATTIADDAAVQMPVAEALAAMRCPSMRFWMWTRPPAIWLGLGGAPRIVCGPARRAKHPKRRSAARPLRVGAANRMLMLPPSDVPRSAARLEPTASMTARTSSMRSSSVANPTSGPTDPCRACRTGSAARTKPSARRIGRPRLVPGQLDVGDESRDTDKVERSFADHLVGDVHVSALGVSGPWSSHIAPSPIGLRYPARRSCAIVVAAPLPCNEG